MKTILTIEIESPDAEQTELFPDEGLTKEDFEGNEQELLDFRTDFAEGLPKAISKRIQKYVNDVLLDDFIDNEEEFLVENWDEFKDYGVKISTKVTPNTK